MNQIQEGQEKIWLWAGSIYTFLQILWNTGMDRKGNIVVVFFQDGIKQDLTVKNIQMCQVIGLYRNLIFTKKSCLLKQLMRNVIITPVAITKFTFSVHVLQKLMKVHCYFFN